jgi:hypothetical protein
MTAVKGATGVVASWWWGTDGTLANWTAVQGNQENVYVTM